MKYFKIISLVFLLIFSVPLSAIFAQVPVAPWAKLSRNAPDNISGRNYTVPTKEEVGIPVFPGAVLTSVSAPREDTLKYKQEILPFITLVTTALPQEVISFYKRNLNEANGWNFTEEYRTFVKGQLSSVLSGFVPAVEVRDETGDNFDLVYVDERLKEKLRTRIRITYKPEKK